MKVKKRAEFSSFLCLCFKDIPAIKAKKYPATQELNTSINPIFHVILVRKYS
ncbi:hypothetical protein [Campylobacter sp. MIT 12-5580]|uniref:hypothetical protein n=1 Tax=Campylobacter sp. MIT 12-5580 TaxID=2040651 RepID=UPI001485BAA5|nr:hypothetical protein [Campylobacter sp. MIT 12-5580]